MSANTFFEERRKDRAAEREEDRRDREFEREEARQERRERKAERRRRRAELRRSRTALYAKSRNGSDTIGALAVVLCSVIPSMYFQLRALDGQSLPALISLCLSVMLECGPWVATVAGERAKRADRPVTPFRLAMWGCASFAAAINFSHAPGAPWLAWVLAASSYGGVFFWELRGWGRTKSRSTRTKSQRRNRRRDRRHDRRRRRRFPIVHRRYVDILTATAVDALDREEAWRRAWRDVHGAAVGVTAPVLAARVSADKALATAVEDAEMTPESIAVELLIDSLFGTGRGDDGPAGGPSDESPSGGPRGGAHGAKTLGRKGKRVIRTGSGRTAPKTPERPLDEADLARVRALADMLGGAAKLSVKTVGEVVGGGNTRYLMALRDAVRAERKRIR
ncbi:hypothetical protein [Streptomyces klenkii]